MRKLWLLPMLFWTTSLLAQYTVVLRNGKTHVCTERYTRTADGFIRLDLAIGGSLTLLPETIDFAETARRNNERVPAWVAELPSTAEKAAEPRPRDSRPSIDYPAPFPEPEPELGLDGVLPELSVPFEDATTHSFAWSDYFSELGFFGYVGLILVLLGLLSAFIANIFFLIAAFRVSVLWGFAVFFIPFAGLFFLFLHWYEAKGPFLWSLASIAVVFLGLVTGSFL